jgi:hypothetical protein
MLKYFLNLFCLSLISRFAYKIKENIL